MRIHPIDNDCNNYELLANASSGSGSGSSQPRTPLKSVIRAHLPNQQRTTVQVYPGQTLREALSKAMRRRKLTPEMCTVFISNTRYVMCDQHFEQWNDVMTSWCDHRQPIEWDRDISQLEGHEILVETRERFPIQTSISHNYVSLKSLYYCSHHWLISKPQVRKTFFTLAFCECCHRLLFHGFRCQTCGIRFHQRCANAVPSLCQPPSRRIQLLQTFAGPQRPVNISVVFEANSGLIITIVPNFTKSQIDAFGSKGTVDISAQCLLQSSLSKWTDHWRAPIT